MREHGQPTIFLVPFSLFFCFKTITLLSPFKLSFSLVHSAPPKLSTPPSSWVSSTAHFPTKHTLSTMWMMDSSDSSDLTMSDSFHGRKLRPLVPRPNASVLPKITVNSTVAISPCISHLHGTDLFAMNHHLGGAADQQSKTDFNTQPFGSSRWNPTPEQLQALEELYRRGTRTPTAEQIQQIAAQLRLFGKIEGKNVFYWFQNHKARERQKRRRELESDSEEKQRDNGSLERKESVLRRTCIEVEQTKNWVLSSNCSTLSEESVSIQRAAVAESRTDGWLQFEERELRQTRSTVERQATWHLMGLTSSPPSQLIDTITTTTVAQALNTIYPKQKPLNPQSLRPNTHLEYETRESQTLQLFPVQGDHSCNAANEVISVAEGENELPITTIDANFTPNQFFEFL